MANVLQDKTEWVELVENGFNKVVGAKKDDVLLGFKEMMNKKFEFSRPLYGEGKAGLGILTALYQK